MQAFLAWEATTRETIDFKTIYVDMAGDLVAGLMLSQIVYWHLPARNGRTKLRVVKRGYHWLAKRYADWHAEIRVSEKQARRGLQILVEKGIVEVARFRFNGAPTTHIRILDENFLAAWQAVIDERKMEHDQRDDCNCPTGQMEHDQRDESLTETTTETTAKVSAASVDAAESLPFSDPPEEEEPAQRKYPARVWIVTLCKVCGVDQKINARKMAAQGKKLWSAGYAAREIGQYYSEGGWWYTQDWRGKRKERPNISTIRETIKAAREYENRPSPVHRNAQGVRIAPV